MAASEERGIVEYKLVSMLFKKKNISLFIRLRMRSELVTAISTVCSYSVTFITPLGICEVNLYLLFILQWIHLILYGIPNPDPNFPYNVAGSGFGSWILIIKPFEI